MEMFPDVLPPEIPVLEEESEDHGVIIVDRTGDRGEEKDELTKELAGIDALTVGSKRSALIHGIPESSASKYSNGKDLEKYPDARTTILQTKHNIHDTAVAKLMETLDLFNPSDIEKPLDRINAASRLAGVVEKISGQNGKGGQNVHLHFHAPRTRKLTEFEVVEVD